MQLKKILMPTDFSACANVALAQAVQLAVNYGAELHFLHVVVLFDEGLYAHDPDTLNVEHVYQRLEDSASLQLKEAMAARQGAPIEVVQHTCRAFEPAPAIVDYADEHGVDMIVLGTHGRRGLRRFLLGSVAEEVVRTASCPVMTLHQDVAVGDDSFGRIVVPFDFSPDSEYALGVAREMAERHGSRIELVHVIQPPIVAGGVYGMPMPGPTMIDGSLQAQKALAAVAESAGGPTVEAHVLEGPPAWELADFSIQSKADLIVIGSHGTSGIRRFLLGSVSEKVVRSAPCPVLVLRRPEDEAEAESAAAG